MTTERMNINNFFTRVKQAFQPEEIQRTFQSVTQFFEKEIIQPVSAFIAPPINLSNFDVVPRGFQPTSRPRPRQPPAVSKRPARPKPLPKVRKPQPKVVKTKTHTLRTIGPALQKEFRRGIQSDDDIPRVRALLEQLVRLTRARPYVIEITEKNGMTSYYTLSDDFVKNMIYTLTGETELDGVEVDYVKALYYKAINVDTVKIKKANQKQNGGKFMKSYHNLNINLGFLQIYKDEQDRNENGKDLFTVVDTEGVTRFVKGEPDEHCFVHSLRMLGFDEHKIGKINVNKLKLELAQNHQRTLYLNKLAERFECCFWVWKHATGKTLKYGKTGKVYKLCLYDGHFMPRLNIPITKKAIQHYDEVKNMENWNLVDTIRKIDGKNTYYIRKGVSVQTNILINTMHDTGRFYWDESLLKYKNFKPPSLKTSELNYDDQTPCEYREPRQVNTDFVFYCDFESIVNEVETHMPFKLGVLGHADDYYKKYDALDQKDLDENRIFQRSLKDLIDKYGDKLKQEKKKDKKLKRVSAFVLYFHNLKYDISLIRKNPYIIFIDELCNGGVVYQSKILYKDHFFILKDSYKMITDGLDKFGKIFNLGEGKKPFASYTYFTPSNFTERYADIKELEKHHSTRGGKPFQGEHFLKEFPGSKPNEIDVQALYDDYLYYDCHTLKQGMLAFDKILYDNFQISSYDYLTISSVSNAIQLKAGACDGCYYNSGLLRKYIMNSVVGGRVCLKDNEKQFMTEPMEDVDCTSLYPSAMTKIQYPKGKAKPIEQTVIDQLNKENNRITNNNPTYPKYDHYVVRVKIIMTGYQQIPMLSKKVNGIRVWSNDTTETVVDEDGNEKTKRFVYCLDKIALEDLHNYYDIKRIKYIDGVCWNEGFNPIVRDVIQHMFDLRAKAKREDNEGLSTVLKLLLNSAYGKTIMKEHPTKTKYILRKDLDSFIANNYDALKGRPIEQVTAAHSRDYDRFKVTTEVPVYDHSNLSHLGSLILSGSKRIMNRVFQCFTDLELYIGYTDTDSFHCRQCDLEKVENYFKEKYKEELMGKSLCEFHADFLEITVKDEQGNDLKVPQYSKMFIAVAPKVYLDVLGNDVTDEIDYHIRCKGVASENLLYYCKEQNISIEELYEKKFYGGEKVKIDICKGKTRFQYDPKGRVFTKDSMVRTLHFPNKK